MLIVFLFHRGLKTGIFFKSLPSMCFSMEASICIFEKCDSGHVNVSFRKALLSFEIKSVCSFGLYLI